jgi:hypothetical protein
MTIINRRNAIFGWAVWQVAKQAAKRKAKEAAPGAGDHARLNKPAIATIVVAAAGGLLIWRKMSGGEATGS